MGLEMGVGEQKEGRCGEKGKGMRGPRDTSPPLGSSVSSSKSYRKKSTARVVCRGPQSYNHLTRAMRADRGVKEQMCEREGACVCVCVCMANIERALRTNVKEEE